MNRNRVRIFKESDDWRRYYKNLYKKTGDEKYLKKSEEYAIKSIQVISRCNKEMAGEILKLSERQRTWAENYYENNRKT